MLTGANCIVDFSQGKLQNTGSMAVNMGANSLVIVPAGFNPATGFGSYTSPGLPVHVRERRSPCRRERASAAWASIVDPVVCQGTITAASGAAINLNNGLVLSGAAA